MARRPHGGSARHSDRLHPLPGPQCVVDFAVGRWQQPNTHPFRQLLSPSAVSRSAVEHALERRAGRLVQRRPGIAARLRAGALRIPRQAAFTNRGDAAARHPAFRRRGGVAIDSRPQRHGEFTADGLVRNIDPVHGRTCRRGVGANAAFLSLHPAQYRGVASEHRFIAGRGGKEFGLPRLSIIPPCDFAIDAARFYRRLAANFHPRHRRSRHAAHAQLQKSSGAPGLLADYHNRYGRCRWLCGLRRLGRALAGVAAGGAEISESRRIREPAARRTGHRHAAWIDAGDRLAGHRIDLSR